jgi:CheY-like chemotaxis protein
MDFSVTFGSCRTRGRRVLCAEDNQLMAILVGRVLGQAGHEVVCVADGRQAWERVRADPDYFDVVITDHQMPVMNGLELVRKLRQLRFAGKIFVQSSKLSPTEEADDRTLKVDGIFQKPNGLFELVTLL